MFDVLFLVASWASIRERGIGEALGPTWLMTPLCCIKIGLDRRWLCKMWSAAERPMCELEVPFAPTAGVSSPNFNLSYPTSRVEEQKSDLITARRMNVNRGAYWAGSYAVNPLGRPDTSHRWAGLGYAPMR